MRPRIRTIKPEFFLDEELYDLEVETGLPIRVCFAGLWTVADRAGRFEWRPRALKANIDPYSNHDFSRVLHALTTRGFVVKYACDTREYGWLPGFTKHQVINNREAESDLPAPPTDQAETPVIPETSDACPTRAPRVPHAACARTSGREGKGREDASSTRDPAPPSATPDESDRRWFIDRWVALYAAGRQGQSATDSNGAGECIAWLVEDAARTGVPFRELAEAKLVAFWAKPFPRAMNRTPAFRHLLQDLPGLAASNTVALTPAEKIAAEIKRYKREERDAAQCRGDPGAVEAADRHLEELRREYAALKRGAA